jgi:hypothetical protein
MNNFYLEHANLTVVDPQDTVKFLTAAIPAWSIRGQGEYENTEIWFHVGDDSQYITIQSGGVGNAQDWTDRWTGVKHLGIHVPSLDELVARLTKAGYQLDHYGGEHPHRKSVYYMENNNMQFEFVEYFSNKATERNDYAL